MGFQKIAPNCVGATEAISTWVGISDEFELESSSSSRANYEGSEPSELWRFRAEPGHFNFRAKNRADITDNMYVKK